MPGRAIKATRLSNRLQPRATRSLRASLVHSLDQSPVHGATVNKELLRTVTNTTRAAQQGAWATRFDAGQAGRRRVPPPGHDRPRPSYGRAQWAKRIRAAVRAVLRRQSNTCKPQALQRGPACSASNEEPAANSRTAVVHASWNARTAPAAGGPIRNALRKAPCKKWRLYMAMQQAVPPDEHTAMGEVHPQGQLASRGALANQPALSCQGRREGSASIHQQPSGCWCEPYSTRRAERSAEP